MRICTMDCEASTLLGLCGAYGVDFPCQSGLHLQAGCCLLGRGTAFYLCANYFVCQLSRRMAAM